MMSSSAVSECAVGDSRVQLEENDSTGIRVHLEEAYSVGSQGCEIETTLLDESDMKQADQVDELMQCTTTNQSDQEEELTMAEKLMLGNLLEKERKKSPRDGTTNLPSPCCTDRKELQRKKMEQSMREAIDELDRMPDDQLMRVVRECESENGDGKTSSVLFWWMKQSKKRSDNRKSTEPNTSTTTVCSTRPKPIAVPGEPGRFIFSFMQEDCADFQGLSSSTMISNTFHENTLSNAPIPENDIDDGIKKSKDEKRRVRRPVKKEDEDQEGLEEFDDDLSDLFEEVLKTKPKKRKQELSGVLWDPEKPRPVPSRLRKGNVKSTK